MKLFNLFTLMLTIIGGLNMGAMAALQADLIAGLFGDGALLTRLLELAIGLSAIYQIYPLVRAFQTDEVHAEVSHR